MPDDPEGNRLSDMYFDEISLVPRGANQPALVTLWKGDRPSMVSCPKGDCNGKMPHGTKKCPTCGSAIEWSGTPETPTISKQQPGPTDVHVGAANKKVVKGSKAPDGHIHAPSNVNGAAGITACAICGAQLVDKQDGLVGDDPQNVSKLSKAVKASLADASLSDEDRESLLQLDAQLDAVTNQSDAGVTIDPASGNPTGGNKVPEEDPNKPKVIDKSALSPEVVAHIEALEKAATAALAEKKTAEDKVVALEDEKKKKEGEPTDPIEKALSKMEPEVRELFKAQQVETKRQADIIKAQQDQAAVTAAISKAATWSKLPTTPQELGPIWKSIAEALPQEAVTTLETLFNSINEQLRQGGIFQTVGKTGSTGTDSSSAIGKVNAAAAEIRKISPELSEAEARAAAVRGNPSLYDDYNRELSAARNGR